MLFISARFPFIAKHSFFVLVFPWFFQVFGPPRRSKLSSMLDLVLGGVLEASWEPPVSSWTEKGCQQGSKLALKTEPKSIKHIDPKIDQLFDASWNRHFSVFLGFGEPETEPCWFEDAFKHQSYQKKLD